MEKRNRIGVETMSRIEKRLKQIAARIRYFGPGYLVDYTLSKLGIGKDMPTVRKKEKQYVRLKGQEYIDELAKWYHASTGDTIDFSNPITFNQKLQWCKVYDTNPLKTLLADKYLVRDWVAEKIGSEYLVPLIGVWDRFDDIDFTKMPKKFALKCNHGSGWNIIVENKDDIDINEIKKKIDGWMGENFAFKAGFEFHYRDIVPKIIAEEYLENSDGDIFDYKLYCFDGKVKYIHFLKGRKTQLRMAYFDREWKKQNFYHNHPIIKERIPKPDNLDKMIQLAEKLSEGFPYVRVDFYRLNDGTIKFGEMTFTPASGTQDWIPEKANYDLGKLLNLPIKL